MLARSISLVVLSTLALGCLADEPQADRLAFRDDPGSLCVGCSWGPPVINTHELNTLQVPSLALDGTERNGARLVGMTVEASDGSSVPLATVQLDRGVLSGTDGSGLLYEGADFIGSHWTVELGEPPVVETVVMTITDFIDDDPRSRYVIHHGPAVGDTPKPNCATDPATGESSMILFEDLAVDEQTGQMSADTGTVYFGCISGAVGKAAMWGYVPWDHGTDMHQTASRVVRADYCGDGKAWTETGVGLQLEDEAKINEFLAPEQQTEAMWGPDGAVCVRSPRHPSFDPQGTDCGGQPLPQCDELDDLSDWPTAIMWSKHWDPIVPALW